MFKKIVVPLDGSPLAEAVLPQVTDLAYALATEVLLLRVAIAHAFPAGNPISLAEAEVRVVREAEAYLAAVAGRLAREGVTVKTTVRYGQAAPEIIDHVAFEGADLVAMSTHGRSGLSRLVMGSVAEEVVRKVGVPVLLFRAQEE